MQATQLAWRLMKQLVFEDDKLVAGTALSLIPNDLLMSIVETSMHLPLCGFATPQTRSGMRCHAWGLQLCA